MQRKDSFEELAPYLTQEKIKRYYNCISVAEGIKSTAIQKRIAANRERALQQCDELRNVRQIGILPQLNNENINHRQQRSYQNNQNNQNNQSNQSNQNNQSNQSNQSNQNNQSNQPRRTALQSLHQQLNQSQQQLNQSQQQLNQSQQQLNQSQQQLNQSQQQPHTNQSSGHDSSILFDHIDRRILSQALEDLEDDNIQIYSTMYIQPYQQENTIYSQYIPSQQNSLQRFFVRNPASQQSNYETNRSLILFFDKLQYLFPVEVDVQEADKQICPICLSKVENTNVIKTFCCKRIVHHSCFNNHLIQNQDESIKCFNCRKDECGMKDIFFDWTVQGQNGQQNRVIKLQAQNYSKYNQQRQQKLIELANR